MRQQLAEKDYMRPIPRWKEAVAAVEAQDASSDDIAMDTLLGRVSSSSTSGPTLTLSESSGSSSKKTETSDAEASTEKAKAEKRIADLIARSRKAFGILHAAIPHDLRLLVADIPHGYAFGIWSFLEKKFRNTEQDSVMALWERLTTVSQDRDETFDVYKARVDSVVELLTHAKQTIPPGLYTSILVWKLQPSYATAVLTLKTNEKMNEPENIMWPKIVEFMAQYERTQLGLSGETDHHTNDRAMAMRGKPSSHKSSVPGGVGFDPNTIECYNCHHKGHFAADCPQPNRRHRGNQPQQKHQNRRRGRDKASSEGVEARTYHAAGKSTGEKTSKTSFAVLSDESDDGDREGAHHRPSRQVISSSSSSNGGGHARSYLARVLAGMQQTARPIGQRPAASSSAAAAPKPKSDEPPPQLKRLKRPGEFNAPAAAAAASMSRRESSTSAPARPSYQSSAASDRDRARPSSAPAKSLDVALRTTARAIDTGATVSITGNKDTLINVRRCMPMAIQMADKTIVSATYKGDMPLRLPVAGSSDAKVRITIKDVYFHERIDANLLSWNSMRVDGWEMHSTKDGTHVLTPEGKRVNTSTRGGLTILEDAGPERAYTTRMGRLVCQSADDLVELHHRLGHASWARLLKMCQHGTTVGIGDVSGMPAAELRKAEHQIKTCNACVQGKRPRNALGHRGLDKGTRPGEVLHMDTFYVVLRDPQTNRKYHEYCLLATDAFTELRWMVRTTSLQALQDEVIGVIDSSTTMSGRNPRLVITDLGTEFDNRKVAAYCRSRGTHLQPSPARAKEMNGVAEKSVDTVKNHVRTMLIAADMPAKMGWMRATAHHVYLWNRTHVNTNTGKTPFEAMTGREPSIMNVGEFGCDAFVHQDRTQRDTTFSPKAEPGIYLGHDFTSNCPIVYMIHTRKTVHVKDVLFREGSFKHLQADLRGSNSQIDRLDLTTLSTDNDDGTDAVVFDTDDESDASTDSAPHPARQKEKYDSASDDEFDDDEASESHRNSTDDEQYAVKSIVGKRVTNGKTEYSVKWVGHPAPTWEPADNISADAPDVVRAYESFIASRATARVTRSSSNRANTPSSTSAPNADDETEADAISAARYVAAKCL
jgi:hypothetical protein